MKDHLGHNLEEQHQKHLSTGKSTIIIVSVAVMVLLAVAWYLLGV